MTVSAAMQQIHEMIRPAESMPPGSTGSRIRISSG
jgi:hypothetical protein